MIKDPIQISIPLYVVQRDRPTPIGTGFFVGMDRFCFLVTAAHVIEASQSQIVHYPGAAGYLIPAFGRLFKDGLGLHHIANRPRDIAVIAMERPPDLGNDHAIADSSALADRLEIDSGRSCVLGGYPISRNRFTTYSNRVPRLQTIVFAKSSSPSAYKTLGLPNASYLVMDFNQQKARTGTDGSSRLPNLSGMSGCPVILANQTGPNSRSDTARIAGVLVRTEPKRQHLIAEGSFVVFHYLRVLSMIMQTNLRTIGTTW